MKRLSFSPKVIIVQLHAQPSSLAGRTPNTESATKAATRPDGDKLAASAPGSVPAGNQRPHEHQLEAKEAPVVDVAKVVPTTGAVMALQAFLQGGLLFLMALSKEAVLLAPASFGLGWMSSTLDMLSLPVLQRFLEPDDVEHQLSTCRVASGVACLFGPLLITLFRDDGPQSYGVIFVVSGGLSLLAGALWLPGVKNEMDEARAKAGPVVATDKTAQVSTGVQHRPSSV
ncbi:hypothetical protein MRX96_011936 [Rhipicephalus microplus]